MALCGGWPLTGGSLGLQSVGSGAVGDAHDRIANNRSRLHCSRPGAKAVRGQTHGYRRELQLPYYDQNLPKVG